MKTYRGIRRRNQTKVIVEDSREEEEAFAELPQYLDIVNHSPSGFEWGYEGSGPAQLSFALLYDVTKDKEFSLHNYQNYKFDVISRLDETDWMLSAKEVEYWIEHLGRQINETINQWGSEMEE